MRSQSSDPSQIPEWFEHAREGMPGALFVLFLAGVPGLDPTLAALHGIVCGLAAVAMLHPRTAAQASAWGFVAAGAWTAAFVLWTSESASPNVLIRAAAPLLATGWILPRPAYLATVSAATLGVAHQTGREPEWYGLFVGLALASWGLQALRARQVGRRLDANAAEKARRVEAEESAQRASEEVERFRRLSQGASEGVLSCRLGVVEDVNPAFLQLFGFKTEDVAGKKLNELSEGWRCGGNADVWRAARKAPVQATAYRSDGQPLPVEISLSPLPGDVSGGGIVRIRDLTADNNAREQLRRAEAQTRRRLEEIEHLYRTAPVGLALIDEDLRIVRLNERLSGMQEKERARPGARLETAFPECGPQVRKLCSKALASGSPLVNQEFESGDEGARRHWSVNLYPLSLGGAAAVSLALEDITERRRAEQQVLRSNERYELAARGANDGLWDWDLKNQRIFYSDRWKAMAGYERPEIGDGPDEWATRVHPEDLSQMRLRLREHLEEQSPYFECEYRLQHRDGAYRWMLSRGVAVRDAKGVPYRMAGSQTDISERKRYEERLVQTAVHDNLTGLPNRTLLAERIDRAMLARDKRPQHRFALLFVDLDRFKVINDSLGHLAGDELLVTVARRIRESVRDRDVVARIGGDEFTVLLDGVVDEEEVVIIAERIQQELARRAEIGGEQLRCSASIGIVMAEKRHKSAEDLLKEADLAMYRAKSLGRSRHALFQSEMSEHAAEALSTETALERALENGEFELYYQPIVASRDGSVVSCEALIRWRRPGKGLASPAEFIPIAEESGAIIGIGEWVLEEACSQVRRWQDAGLPCVPVAVNLSPRQLGDRDLAQRVRRVLQKTQLAPEMLTLELTETALLENLEADSAVLTSLSSLGIRLALDDFGTGYCSLSYLTQFPTETLKISERFTQRIVDDEDLDAITRILIELAHTLRMRVVAEGVETEEQRRRLEQHGCDSCQGYLFGRPAPAEEMAAILAAGKAPAKAMLEAENAASSSSPNR